MAFLEGDRDSLQKRLNEMGIDVLDLVQSNELSEWQRKLIMYFLEEQLTEVKELNIELNEKLNKFLEA